MTNTTFDRALGAKAPARKADAPPTRRPKAAGGSESATTSVAEAIRRSLRDGFFVPGQRLLEGDLAQQFGCSKGPVREALFMLAGEGLLRILPHRGAVVRRLTRREMLDSYRLLELLDGLTVRLAAENIGKGDNRARLDGLVAALRDPHIGRLPQRYLELKRAFHSLLLEISGNRQLAHVVHQQRSILLPLQIRGFLNMSNLEALNAHYEEIMNAVLAGDAATAEREMQRYTGRLSELVATLPDECFAPALPEEHVT